MLASLMMTSVTVYDRTYELWSISKYSKYWNKIFVLLKLSNCIYNIKTFLTIIFPHFTKENCAVQWYCRWPGWDDERKLVGLVSGVTIDILSGLLINNLTLPTGYTQTVIIHHRELRVKNYIKPSWVSSFWQIKWMETPSDWKIIL